MKVYVLLECQGIAMKIFWNVFATQLKAESHLLARMENYIQVIIDQKYPVEALNSRYWKYLFAAKLTQKERIFEIWELPI